MEHIRRYLYDKYGKEQLYSGGLRVYTKMDLKMQILAQNALRDGLIAHDRRQGYRGPVKNLLQEVDQELGLYIFDIEKGWNPDKFKGLDKESKAIAQKLFAEKIETATIENHFVIGGNVLGVVTRVDPHTIQVNLGRFPGNLLLSSMRWARPVNYKVEYFKENLSDFNEILKIGDVVELEILDYDHVAKEFSLVLTQKPIANGGMLAMNPLNGEVLALIGGYDFRESEFNRAIQGKRQTGSAFKPIAYSLALESSFTASSMLDDTPFVEGDYKPDNDSKKFKGKMSLRDALVHSENNPSVRLAKELGINAIIDHARKLGITADLPEDLTIILGSASITLEEMTVAFSTFANGGKLVTPSYISRIEDRDGNVLEEEEPHEPKQVLSPETAFLMTSILQDVVRRGTGWRAREINRPSAGKTGTTNDYTNAWYIGFVPQLIAGAYIGFDTNQQTLGDIETGSRAAAPVWIDFMSLAIDTMPILPFEQPDGINMVKINIDSGLLECDSSGNSKYEYYKASTEPTQCHRSSIAPNRNNLNTGDKLNQDQELQDEQPYIEEL
jgi:penicillin-binding protein 1A